MISLIWFSCTLLSEFFVDENIAYIEVDDLSKTLASTFIMLSARIQSSFMVVLNDS